MCKVLENQISNGRKIFRLLLWLNEISEIHSILSSKKLTRNLKVLKTLSATFSFIYYFTDNIVWFSKIGFFDKEVPFSKQIFFGKVIKWGQIKDQFSLFKTILELIIYLYTLKLKTTEELLLFKKLSQMDDVIITKNHLSHVYLRKIVILRREMRFINTGGYFQNS